MKPVDHALVEQLLADETLSYKEIARRASCSDFSVRTIARKLSGDDRPTKRVSDLSPEILDHCDELPSWAGWALFGGLVAAIGGAIWLASRGLPPGGPMP